MEQAGKASVPKFASFKPKTHPPVSQQKEPGSVPEQERPRRHRSYEDDHERDRESSHHHQRHTDSRGDDQERRRRDKGHRDKDPRDSKRHEEHRQRRRHRSRSKRRHESEEKSDNRVIPQPRIPIEHEEKALYIVDRKGDQANLTYGRLHQYSVPAYRRAGYGCVLGLSSDARIDRFASDDRNLVINNNRRHGKLERQLLSKQHRPKEAQTLRVTKPSASDPNHDFDPNQDFIAVRSRKRKRGSESPGSESEQVDYRSIEGKAKPSKQPEDSDLEYASDDADPSAYQDFFADAKERNALLSRSVQDEPANLQSWLDLVQHQESMLRIGSSDVHRQLKASEKHALASLRLDIYQRALQAMHSDRLVVGLMEESSKVHQRQEHFNRWKQILEKHPESTDLWIKYLDTLQTSLAEFHFEDCRSKFLECLKMLRETSTHDLRKLRVYIFLRLTTLMRDAGYREQAIALWQALLEFQLFRPPRGDGVEADQISTVLKDFEEFWESECPRIGEPGSAGWTAFKQDGTWSDPPEEPIADARDEHRADNLFENFAVKENSRMDTYQWPGRTTDETGDDDPFHVVLFTDLEAELGLLQDDLPHVILVEAFLCFWNLPPLPTSDLQTRMWWLDPFLRTERLRNDRPLHTPLQGPSDNIDLNDHPAVARWDPPMEFFQVTSEEIFNDNFFATELIPEQKDWLRRTLKMLVNKITDDAIAEYSLAFEWYCNPTGAAKAAKALLKKRSSSLRLYNAYALIEHRSGRTMEANRVFSMAIGMSTQLPYDAQKSSVLLWRTWIWEALRGDDLKAARHRISSIGDAKPTAEPQASSEEESSFHPGTLLKVRNTLTEGRDYSLSTGDPMLAMLHAECLALLAYFQSHQDIMAALDVLHHTSHLLETRNLLHSSVNEAAQQAKCQLLTYHSKHVKLFKPAIARSEVQESILLFPNNTKLLAVYAANEARFRVDDRVRAIMQDVVLKKADQTIVGWFFSIYAEMKRGENLGGTTHAVRAAFEKAAESKSGENSAALWASYVLYLCSAADLDTAKTVFFRGLLHLPYSKSYIMLAFEHLKDAMDFKELRSVYNTLQEKELRVHVELDDMLEDAQRRLDGGKLQALE